MDILTPDAALVLADRHWRIRGDICALPSYADQNFRIRTEHGEYVLKVAHPSWSRMDLDLENKAMMTLAEREPALQWPRVQLAVGGEHLLTLPIAGQSCQVRVLSFVPGTTYADAIGVLPLTRRAALHESLGSAVGRLTRGLQDFHHPAAGRQHDWNLLRLPTLCDEIAHISDVGLRAIVEAQVKAFCSRLPQWQAQLEVVEPVGNEVILNLDCGGHGLVARLPPQSLPERGARMTLAFDPAALHFFDAADGTRIASQSP